MTSPRMALMGIILSAAALSACHSSHPGMQLVPTDIDASTTCSLDGMTLADYPGPKAQIHYAGQAKPTFFCDTVEMFHAVFQPEQVKAIDAIFVQDMGQADWVKPQGRWIDAKAAFYVHGSKQTGSMGPTIVSFALRTDADQFAAKNGGKVFKFTEVTPQMADLCGGSMPDSKM